MQETLKLDKNLLNRLPGDEPKTSLLRTDLPSVVANAVPATETHAMPELRRTADGGPAVELF